MYAFRLALRRTTPMAAATTRQATFSRSLGVRYCSSASAVKASEIDNKPEDICIRTEENVDVVRDAIAKMLIKDEVDVKPISDEELESNLAKFVHLFEEARACINDVREARKGSLEWYEEAYTAQRAVDKAFSSYTDLLDDFRRANDEQLRTLCQDRLNLANTLKALRQEVHELSQPKKDART